MVHPFFFSKNECSYRPISKESGVSVPIELRADLQKKLIEISLVVESRKY